MHTIRIFQLGYARDVDLGRVCQIINRSQRVIRAEKGPRVDSIGEPDIESIGYSKRQLFAHFPESSGAELLTGVTHAPIENNFFSITQLPGRAVITLHGSEVIRDEAKRSPEEYLAQSVITEFLQVRYMLTPLAPSWETLVHREVRGCLFDLVPLKSDKVNKLRRGRIDAECRNKLATAGVSAETINAVESVVRAAQVPTLARSFTDGLQQPVYSLLLGSLAGGILIELVSSLITDSWSTRLGYALLVVALLIGLLVCGNWIRVRHAAQTEPKGS